MKDFEHKVRITSHRFFINKADRQLIREKTR